MTARDVSVSTLWAVNRPPLQVWSPCSEDEFNSQLNTPRASRSQHRVASEYVRCLRHRGELARTAVARRGQVQVCVRGSVDVGMVEDVEELAAELGRELLVEFLSFAYSYIGAPVTWAAKQVSGRVPKRSQSGRSQYRFSLRPTSERRERSLRCSMNCAKRIVDGHIRSHVRYARPRINACERRARRRCAGREKLWDIAVGFVVKAKIVRISKEVPARQSAICPLEVARVCNVYREAGLEFEAAADFPSVQQSPGALLSG